MLADLLVLLRHPVLERDPRLGVVVRLAVARLHFGPQPVRLALQVGNLALKLDAALGQPKRVLLRLGQRVTRLLQLQLQLADPKVQLPLFVLRKVQAREVDGRRTPK